MSGDTMNAIVLSGFTEGQRVFGLVGGGGYAEYALIDHKMAMPIPEGWDFSQAAAVPEVFFTAHETLFVLGALSGGMSVLIHAGGSGVGTTAIQMCSHAGARVFFTAGSPEKIQRAEALGKGIGEGAQPITGINYKTQDFQQEILEHTGQEGVDVILDFIGAGYLARNLASLRNGGRLVVAALMGGAQAQLDLGPLLRKRLQIIGSVMRARPLADKRAITERFRQRWLPLLIDGTVQPIIDRAFPLAEARQAHEHMEANRNFGKIMLEVG